MPMRCVPPTSGISPPGSRWAISSGGDTFLGFAPFGASPEMPIACLSESAVHLRVGSGWPAATAVGGAPLPPVDLQRAPVWDVSGLTRRTPTLLHVSVGMTMAQPEAGLPGGVADRGRVQESGGGNEQPARY
jgi:hypothetical protein